MRDLREALGHRQIPAEQYDVIRRTQLRFRSCRWSSASSSPRTAIFFTLTGNVFSVFVLLPLAMMTWFFFVRPLHRRRYRRAIAEPAALGAAARVAAGLPLRGEPARVPSAPRGGIFGRLLAQLDAGAVLHDLAVDVEQEADGSTIRPIRVLSQP